MRKEFKVNQFWLTHTGLRLAAMKFAGVQIWFKGDKRLEFAASVTKYTH